MPFQYSVDAGTGAGVGGAPVRRHCGGAGVAQVAHDGGALWETKPIRFLRRRSLFKSNTDNDSQVHFLFSSRTLKNGTLPKGLSSRNAAERVPPLAMFTRSSSSPSSFILQDRKSELMEN